MSGAKKTEVSPSGFAPHIEELHDLFRSRSVGFGAPEDLGPFVERLSKDASFCDEMSSMVRAIIYRERDGLTPAELLELLVTAVAGMAAEDTPETARDAVRQMMGFIGGVFRSRWNPGGSAARTEDKSAVGVEGADGEASAAKADDTAAMSAPAETTARPVTPIFYQAQVVANGGEAPEDVVPVRESRESNGAPVWTADSEVTDEVAAQRVAAFLRSKEMAAKPAEAVRSRSRVWIWATFAVAIVAAFCAGMFVRQWMLMRSGVVRRARVTLPALVNPSAAPALNSGAANPPGGAVNVRSGKTAARRPAQVEAARSEWQGGAESASDMGEPARSGAGSGTALLGAAASSASGSTSGSNDGATAPMTGVSKPSPEVPTNLPRSGEARATAMVGASPALMGSRLLFAPEPEYPELARLAHVQGAVVVQALVGRDGTVVRARAVSGHRMLRGAAERAVYGRRYRPYVVNGIPMAVRTLVTVDFRLQ
jgi:outer membrane biosynthesis protein TonB